MPRWLLIWVVAVAFTVVGWFGFESVWRKQGYLPTVMDSLDLWSLHRARAVKSTPPKRVALLGASRIQYGISPKVFRDESKRMGQTVDPVMLAVNGHYPLAALRDLADDERFVGIAIVGIDSRGMDRQVWEMQAKHVGHYRHEWSPSRELHRHLLTHIQARAIAARSDFALVGLISRALDGQGVPHKEYVTFSRDRSGGTDYARSDIAAIREARLADLRKYFPLYTPPAPHVWLGDLREVKGWVERINRRGGTVVFYREPVSGELLVLEEKNFPRERYWDRLAAMMPATMIDFRDEPSLNFDTPDMSHIDSKDIEGHTRALVRVLRERGVL